MILLAAALAGADAYPLACSYWSPRELEPVAACARVAADGTLGLAPRVAADLRYRRGLAEIFVGGHGWFYRRRDGRSRPAVSFDNGADPFAEGLARARLPDGFAWYDRTLTVRIRTRYTWGDRFHAGRAAVCTGCREETDGEHGWMTGGRWAVIDRRGREVAGR